MWALWLAQSSAAPVSVVSVVPASVAPLAQLAQRLAMFGKAPLKVYLVGLARRELVAALSARRPAAWQAYPVALVALLVVDRQWLAQWLALQRAESYPGAPVALVRGVEAARRAAQVEPVGQVGLAKGAAQVARALVAPLALHRSLVAPAGKTGKAAQAARWAKQAEHTPAAYLAANRMAA